MKILAIRGGGIGDFLLTLPALKLLRGAACKLDVLGYRRVLGLVDGRGIADGVRSIESAHMAACFNPAAVIDDNLAAYFAGFDQIVSYLFDPDRLFEHTMKSPGAGSFLGIDPRIGDDGHAALQLARPLEHLGLFLETPFALLNPSDADRREAAGVLAGLAGPWVAVHPGSGGESKNWGLAGWESVLSRLLATGLRVVLVGGEADERRVGHLLELFDRRVRALINHPLEILAACLARCALFIGHDSGISHLAAASGSRCLLLFGPTNPAVWAPANPGVAILRAPEGNLALLEPEEVWQNLLPWLP
jgi:heptosyltransferase III